MTPDEQQEIARRVAESTRENDPNPGGRFPSGSYRTPDEARERGEGWVSRPGEPQDLSDPYHYQSPDEARALGREWGTQPAIMQGRATHAGWQGGRAAVDPGRATLGAMVGMQAPVSRTLPGRMPGNGVPPPQGTPAVTLGDWLQMTSTRAPDWRYLSGRS